MSGKDAEPIRELPAPTVVTVACDVQGRLSIPETHRAWMSDGVAFCTDTDRVIYILSARTCTSIDGLLGTFDGSNLVSAIASEAFMDLQLRFQGLRSEIVSLDSAGKVTVPAVIRELSSYKPWVKGQTEGNPAFLVPLGNHFVLVDRARLREHMAGESLFADLVGKIRQAKEDFVYLQQAQLLDDHDPLGRSQGTRR